MDSDSLIQIIAIIILILLSAFFSASETAYTKLNRIRIKSLAENGNHRAKTALSLATQYDKLLSTILIGNNIVNIASASLATIIFTRFLGNNGVSISTVVMTILVLIFGEITPKSIAMDRAESFALKVAPILKGLLIILTPLNFLFMQWKKLVSRVFKKKNQSKVTPEELIAMIDEAEHEGGVDEHNGELIRSAIEFNDLEAKDILTPRVDLIAIEKDTPLDQIAEIFMSNPYSRFPVYEESIDSIIGMIHEKDFYIGLHNQMTSIDGIIKKVAYVSPGTQISDLLRLLQRTKTHIAIVVDEFGGTEGIVTMEDILEELVGDIWDEHDEVKHSYEQINNLTYLISCSTNLEDMFEDFHLNEKNVEYESVTVGGWVMEQLGKIPTVGDSFSYEGAEFTVTKADERHILEVQVHLKEPLSDEIS